MMSLETIRAISEEKAIEAAAENKQPYVAYEDHDPGVFNCPHLGDYIPEGWVEIEELFVDSSGFGSENEPALTTDQFLEKVKGGLGYAVSEAGQFQVFVRVFKRVD